MLGSFISDIVGLFGTALLPPLIFCAIGAGVGKVLRLDRRTMSRLLVFVLLPPLLFRALLRVEVTPAEVVQVAVFTVAILLGMGTVALLFSRLTRMDAGMASGALLAVTFFNAVNLGFPISYFAFGERGLRLAGVLVAVNAIPHNGFGLFIAARGRLTTRQAFGAIAKMPTLYAMALALVFRLVAWTPPAAVLGPIDELAEAAVPLTLIVIGMELARCQLGTLDGRVAGVVLLRLLLAPVLAWHVANAVGLTGLLRSIVVLQASMPSAIAPIIYARVFGGRVDFVSRAVFYSTVGSLLTLPLLLLWLQRAPVH